MDNYNSFSGEGRTVQTPVCDKVVTTELSGDFSLPDYQPEIKRLLRVTASVLPSSKYFSQSSAEFAGNIDYYVLYTGSDNEVYCAPLTGEYNVSVPLEGGEMGETYGSAEISPDMISGRVTAPRKLSIRCRLKTHARIHGETSVDCKCGVDTDPATVQRLDGELKAARVFRGMGETLRLSDEIIPDSHAGEVRVICAEGRVLVNEVTSARDEINCRGEVHLKLMMSRENGSEPYSVVRKMPFVGSVPMSGTDMNCSCMAKGTVSELSVTVEDGRIATEVGIILEGTAQRNESISYTKDMFSTVYDSECEYRTLNISHAGNCFNGNFTLSDSHALDEVGISPDARVVDCSGMAYVEDTSFERGKCIVTGRAKFNLQLMRDGEFSPSEIEFPFKYEAVSVDGMSGCEAEACAVSCRARIDGERVGVDAEIAINGRTWAEEEVSMLTEVHFGEQIERSRGDIVICYPAPDDTLWSVAGRYRTKLSDLVDANQLSQAASPDSRQSLEGVQYLIV